MRQSTRSVGLLAGVVDDEVRASLFGNGRRARGGYLVEASAENHGNFGRRSKRLERRWIAQFTR